MSASPAIDTRLHPLEALAAIRRLFDRPEDTRQVFIVLRAMRGRSALRSFERFAASPTGEMILRERRSLLARLQDRAALARLPDGALGRAYLGFMTTENLSADGLVAVSEAEWQAAPDDAELFRARQRDMHDLLHVLTGYGRDPLGELCLLAFNYAQTRHPGMAMIALMGMLRLRRAPNASVARRAVIQAWRHGRRAAWLAAEPWEEQLSQPVAELRHALRIGTPTRYREAMS